MDLLSFPRNLLWDILFKMRNREIVRMRRTCSAVNSFIDDNKWKLSSRPEIGLYLYVFIERDDPEKIVAYVGGTKIDYRDDLGSMLSAISVRKLDLHIEMETTTIEQVRQLEDDRTYQLSRKLADFIKTVKISCDRLHFYNFPPRVAVEVADHIPTRISTLFDYNGLEVSDYFRVLSKSKNSSSFFVAFLGLGLDHRLFEKAKKCHRLCANPMTHALFRSFLWEICRSTDHGNFFELQCLTERLIESRDFDFNDPDFPLPAFRTIWDKSTVPPEMCKTKTPDYIRIFNQAGNTVIYVEEHYKGGVEIVVYVARNKELYLSCLVRDFSRLKIRLPDGFISATDDEQVILFRNAFLTASHTL